VAWQSLQFDDGTPQVAVQPETPLSFVGDSFSDSLFVQRGDVPVVAKALAVGNVRVHDETGAAIDQATAPDLSGIDTRYQVTGTAATIPRYGNRGAIVDLVQVAAGAGVPTSYDVFSVWLARDDTAREHTLVRRLAAQGVVLTHRDTLRAHEAALRRQGPTLALRLALLAGFVGLVLAAVALPIGVATSGGSRARDLAALRLVGVPARAIRAAAVREHLVVAVLGTVAGVVLGLLAAQAALPQVPLVSGPAPRLPVVLDPAWPTVAAAALGALTLLVATSVAVGRSLARSARPGLLRSGQ
jgi:ABC-type lipoprotein release transport system permease subunit